MKQKDAYVFLGISESLEKLNQSTRCQYIDDDDFKSWFEELFKISYYNEDFRDVFHNNSLSKLQESIKNLGYTNAPDLSEKIMHDFRNSKYVSAPINSAVIILKEYCDYDKKILTIQGDNIMLFYLGEYQLVF
jgi:hypothetical protein